MATRKSVKKVLEYDPLAWLKEEDGDGEQTEKQITSQKKVVKKQAATAEADAVMSPGSALTIKTVEEFKQSIDQRLADDCEIIIDTTDLQKIDTAGLQLLLSLQASLNAQGRGLTWADKNPLIESAAQLLGLPDFFNDAAAGFGFFEDDSTDEKQDQGFGFF